MRDTRSTSDHPDLTLCHRHRRSPRVLGGVRIPERARAAAGAGGRVGKKCRLRTLRSAWPGDERRVTSSPRTKWPRSRSRAGRVRPCGPAPAIQLCLWRKALLDVSDRFPSRPWLTRAGSSRPSRRPRSRPTLLHKGQQGYSRSGPTSVAERHRSWSWVQFGQIGPSQGKPLSWASPVK